MRTFYDIVLPYAVISIITDIENKVIEAPPIASWMIGKDIQTVSDWVAKKNGYFRAKGLTQEFAGHNRQK